MDHFRLRLLALWAAGCALAACLALASPAADRDAIAFAPGGCITDLECETLHGPEPGGGERH